MENNVIPAFDDVKEAIASGKPFKLAYDGFDLKNLNESEKRLIKDALMHNHRYFQFQIKSKDENIFVGDLLASHPKATEGYFRIASTEGLEYLAEGFKRSNMEVVEIIQDYSNFDDISIAIEALKDVKSLCDVRLHPLPGQEHATAQVFSNPNIQSFRANCGDFDDGTLQRMATVLATHPSMTELEIGFLSPTAIIAFGEALKTNTVLKKITLGPIVDSSEGMHQFCEGLKNNSTLESLCLTNDKSEESQKMLFELFANDSIKVSNFTAYQCSVTLATMGVLSESLKTNSVLTTLDMPGCDIDKEKCRLLCDALTINKTLKTLMLEGNDVDVNAISSLLKQHTTLEELNLAECRLTADSLRILCDVLKSNKTLLSWNLFANPIDDTACEIICDTLKTNTTLTSLNIGDHYLSRKTTLRWAKAIEDLLLFNDTLRYLNISNRLEDNFEIICEALKVNQSITRLVIRTEDKKLYDMMIDVLKVNEAITSLELSDSSRPEIDALTNRNRRLHSDFMYNVAILSHNIAHSESALEILPREIWQKIIKELRCPGVFDLDRIIDKAFK